MEVIVAEEVSVPQKPLQEHYFKVFLICLAILAFLSIWFLKSPIIAGDGLTYKEAMNVLQGRGISSGFVPNRILTTFAGLESIIFLSKILGSLTTAWIALNLFFYFVLNIIFYKLVHALFKDEKTALLASLFLASNYALLSFGLNYLMDIGGWTFYILSLYYTLRYVQDGKNKYIFLSALCVGIGGLFKEYAFLGFIPLILALIYTLGITKESIKNALLASLLSFVPIILVSISVLKAFHYTYLNWLGSNQIEYVYHSRLVEYIKSLGSLWNVLGLILLAGMYCFFKYGKELIPEKKLRFFILSVGISVLPIFIWPAITQRVLFVTVPAIILISSFFFKRYQRFFYGFLFIIFLYALASFFMDSFLLKAVNLPF